MSTYFRVDSTRISLGEYWRMGGPVGVLVGMASKVFRFRIDMQQAYRKLDALTILEPEKIPIEARNRMADFIAEGSKRGLMPQFFYTIPILTHDRTYAVVLMDPEGEFIANVIDCHSKRGAAETIATHFSCLTLKADNKWVTTSTQKKMLDPVPWSDDGHWPGASATEVITKHREQIASIPPAKLRKIKPDEVETLIRDVENRLFEHRLRTGFYMSMSDAEVAVLKTKVGQG